jgi:hypothetical protein
MRFILKTLNVICTLNAYIYVQVYIHTFCMNNFTCCILTPSDGTLNGVPCQGLQVTTSWHANYRLPDVRKRVGHWGRQESPNFQTQTIVVIWLQYC